MKDIYSLNELWEKFDNYPKLMFLFDAANNETEKAYNCASIDRLLAEYGYRELTEFSVVNGDTEFELYVSVE